jgi:hypothetical protein
MRLPQRCRADNGQKSTTKSQYCQHNQKTEQQSKTPNHNHPGILPLHGPKPRRNKKNNKVNQPYRSKKSPKPTHLDNFIPP